MTGNLTIYKSTEPTLKLRHSDIQIGTDLSQLCNIGVLYFGDANDLNVATLFARYAPEKRTEVVLRARNNGTGSNVDNYLVLGVTNDGTKTVAVSNNLSWRYALSTPICKYISSGSMHDISESGIYYVANAVTDKPSNLGGLLIFAIGTTAAKCGLYVTNAATSPKIYAVSVIGTTWTYTVIN